MKKKKPQPKKQKKETMIFLFNDYGLQNLEIDVLIKLFVLYDQYYIHEYAKTIHNLMNEGDKIMQNRKNSIELNKKFIQLVNKAKRIFRIMNRYQKYMTWLSREIRPLVESQKANGSYRYDFLSLLSKKNR